MDFRQQVTDILAANAEHDEKAVEALVVDLSAELLTLFQRGVVALETIASRSAP